ncbi:MAG: tRNA (guanosine(46)-N7)-methyltransferase TrmB, partial [Pseudomonadota bacterium]
MKPAPWDKDRLFGRHQNKALKPRQARLMETLLPKVAVRPETIGEMVATHDGEAWLEVGFGGGE